MTNQLDLIIAAGGVVVRQGVTELEVVLVHRPHHDDWSLPKGKQDGNETNSETALREVFEEVGLVCELGAELTPVKYVEPNRRRDKIVHYWIMCPLNADEAVVDGDECDELRWCTVEQALALLTYQSERDVVRQAWAMLYSPDSV